MKIKNEVVDIEIYRRKLLAKTTLRKMIERGKPSREDIRSVYTLIATLPDEIALEVLTSELTTAQVYEFGIHKVDEAKHVYDRIRLASAK